MDHLEGFEGASPPLDAYVMTLRLAFLVNQGDRACTGIECKIQVTQSVLPRLVDRKVSQSACRESSGLRTATH